MVLYLTKKCWIYGLEHRLGRMLPTDTEWWAMPILQNSGNQQPGFVEWALPTKR